MAPKSHLARISLLLAILASLLHLPALGQSQEPARRLILKDGSYQLVTKYEVKGNRVRYYSAEREEWEELPNVLVDWPATEQYEKDRAAHTAVPEAVEVDKEIAHEEELAAAKLPEVAPGLRLPENNGVFMLDNFQGEPQVIELQQSVGDVNQGKAGIFRGAITPLGGMKQAIELDGAHAKIQAHVDVPSLYINVDDAPGQPVETSSAHTSSKAQEPQQPEQPQQPQQPIVPFNRYRIVKVEVKGSRRVVGNVKRQPATGKVTEDEHFIKTTISGVTGGWLKLTPIETLPPGEYALVEMLGQEGMNLDVWDFGVNPKAPGNANPWKPEAKPAAAPPSSDPGSQHNLGEK